MSPEYFPISGGTGAYVFYLSRELQKLGHDVNIITRHIKDSTETVDGMNVTYVKSVGNPFSRYWAFARSTAKKLQELNKKFEFDIVHANLPLIPNFAIPKKSGKALVSTVHSTWKGEAEAIKHESFRRLNSNERFMIQFNFLLKSSEKKLMKCSDALIGVSLYTKKELTEFYSIEEEKIRVIYNGVDIRKFKPNNEKASLRRALGLETEKSIILYVGRLYNRKGLPILMQSIPKIIQHFEDTRFIISGGGSKQSERKLKELIKELDIENYVSIVGYFPDEKLPDLYAASDIFVLPALYENFPFALLEAQSTALPVVSTTVGGIPELVINRQTGLLVDPSNFEQLAEAIMTLLANPKLAKEFGQRGRQLVEERFAWPIVTSQVVDLYRSVSEPN